MKYDLHIEKWHYLSYNNIIVVKGETKCTKLKYTKTYMGTAR